MRRLSLWAAVALVACSRSATAPQPLFANFTVQSRQLMYGDTLRLELSVTNKSREDVTYQSNTCNRHFEVLDSNGEIVGPNERIACTEEIRIGTIAAGQTVVIHGFFTGTAPDRTEGPLPGPVTFLREGKYTIRPSLLLLPSAERLRGKAITVDLVRFLPD